MVYTAIVLDEESRKKLIKRFIHLIPADWHIIAHHVTLNMGPIQKGPADPSLLGNTAELTVVSVAADDKVMAVGVTSEVPSKNEQPHITLAVNRAGGGKPVMSNNLRNWETLSDPFDLFGTVEEVR